MLRAGWGLGYCPIRDMNHETSVSPSTTLMTLHHQLLQEHGIHREWIPQCVTCVQSVLCKVQVKKNLFSKNVFAYKNSQDYSNTKVIGFIMGHITLNDIVTKQLAECPFTFTSSYTL